jgi:hypothetical protein
LTTITLTLLGLTELELSSESLLCNLRIDMQNIDFPLFNERTRETLHRMKWFPMHRTWLPIMESWSNEKILELLHTHTPEEIKVLLNKKDPPTFSQLLKLPWTDTSDLGTYAKLVFSGREKDATSKEHWVYVGSATNIAVGLRGRRKNHEKPSKQE